MLIRFERTVEDIMVFKDYHLMNSTLVKRFVFLYRWLGALICLAFFLFFGSLFPSGAPRLFMYAMALIAPSLFAAYAYRITQWQTRCSKSKVMADGDYVKFVGQQQLELTDTGFQTHSDYFQAKIAWEAIDHIVSTSDHTFIYLDPNNAYIIPHDKVFEGDFRALLAELHRRHLSAHRLQLAH